MLKESLLVFIILLSGCVTANVQTTTVTREDQNNNLPEKLRGIWEFKGIRSNNVQNRRFSKVSSGQFKLYGGDGAFANFGMTRSNALISSEGTWEAISDSAVVEHVSRSIHSGLAGKDDTLYYKLMNDRGFLYLKWHRNTNNNGSPADVWVEEIWRHVDLPEAGRKENFPRKL